MKKIITALLFASVPCFAQFSDDEEIVPPVEDVSLSATHILPSTSVIPTGSLLLGTTIGTGFFDRMEITSNLFLDLQQVFNVAAKLKVIRTDNFGFAVFGSYWTQSVNVQAASGLNASTSQNMSAISPGAVFSYRVSKKLVGHLGGTYAISNPVIEKDKLYKKTAYLQGFTVNKEFGILVGGVAITPGVSYDITYDIPGVGASVHFSGFQIGGHYYTNVSDGSFVPIVSAGFAAEI